MRKLLNGAQASVVGLAGKAGSGKDFIGHSIILPQGFFPWAFAWPLKTGMIGKLMGSYQDFFIDKPIEKRKLMQAEGTERGRNVHGEQLWTETTLAWLTVLNESLGLTQFVITDARFPNEIEFIKSLGGRVYYIHAPDRTQDVATPMDAESRRHASETSLDLFAGFDGVIDNSRTRTDVQEQTLALLIRDGFLQVEGVEDGQLAHDTLGLGC